MKIRNIIIIFIIITVTQFSTYCDNVYAISIEERDHTGKLVYSGGEPENKNRFEIGSIGFPVMISYAILLSLGIIFFKKRSNKIISRILNFILNFEINKKISIFTIVGLVTIYIIININKLWDPDEISWGDYNVVLKSIEDLKTSPYQIQLLPITWRYYVLVFSNYVLGNIRIMPFIESISLVILTYFLTVGITKKRFSGIVSIIILIQSNLFLKYSVAATEDNLWTLFFVLSVYLVLKKGWLYISPGLYYLSLTTKPLVILYLPALVFFIYRSIIPKNNKIKIYILYLLTSIVLVTAIFFGLFTTGNINFDIEKFVDAFKILSSWLHSDMIISLFLLPLIVGLYIKSRKGVVHADSIMLLILSTVISAPLLISVTDITNQPYRFVPAIVFFAIGMGMLFSNDYIVSRKKPEHVSLIIFSVSFIIILFSTISIIFPALIQTSSVY